VSQLFQGMPITWTSIRSRLSQWRDKQNASFDLCHTSR